MKQVDDTFTILFVTRVNIVCEGLRRCSLHNQTNFVMDWNKHQDVKFLWLRSSKCRKIFYS